MLDRADATVTDELRRRLGDVLPAGDLQHLATTLRRLRSGDPTPRSTP